MASLSHSPEDVHTLPDYTQNILPELNKAELPTLILTSHGHSPPLNPAPDLRVDVRNLPNPPKHIRDAYNGTSKRLQEWIKEDPVFVTRRDAIRMEIEVAMTVKMDEHEKNNVLKVEPNHDEKEPQDHSSAMKQGLETDEVNVASDEEEADGDEDVNTAPSSDEESDPTNHSTNLRVGIFCAMGRHRSVAMVEELAKMSWPGWQVKVEHRDISKKRGGGKKAGGRDKKSRGTRGGASSYVNDDYE